VGCRKAGEKSIICFLISPVEIYRFLIKNSRVLNLLITSIRLHFDIEVLSALSDSLWGIETRSIAARLNIKTKKEAHCVLRWWEIPTIA
jgi:hypothetical protein